MSDPTMTDKTALEELARRLAVALHEKHYRDEVPQWQPLPDLRGLISQIDNMTSGLSRTDTGKLLAENEGLTPAEKFTRRVDISPSFERIHPNPSVNYGIGAMRLWFLLIGPKGAVQWQIGTNWYCKRAQEHLRSVRGPLIDTLGYENPYQPQAWDLGYHAREPQYDSHTPMDGECHVIGGTCYYDGSGLNAELLIDGFLEGGERFLWPALEAYYRHTFEGGEWPDFEGMRAAIKAEDDAAHAERVNAKLGSVARAALRATANTPGEGD